MFLTTEEVKVLLASRYTEKEIIDLLELDTYSLVEYLSDRIEENIEYLSRELELTKGIEDAEDY